MNKAPEVALISEELLLAFIDVLPPEVQARVMAGRSKDGELVTTLAAECCDCRCCGGAR